MDEIVGWERGDRLTRPNTEAPVSISLANCRSSHSVDFVQIGQKKKERKEIAINFLALEYIPLSISTIERKRESKLGSTSEIG